MDTERYKKLVTAVETLSETEKEEIFKMIHKYGYNYTKNNNGVFVNLAWIPETLLSQLECYVEFCNKSDIEIRKYESLCDILNTKLQAGDECDSNNVEKGKQLDIDCIDIDDQTKLSKMSSSTKFMMLKKKYAKLATFVNYENDLESSQPVIL